MMNFTLASVLPRLTPGRPLLIVDADEVLLLFVAGLDRYLAPRGLHLDLRSFRLHGNIKRHSDGFVVPNDEVTALLNDYRATLADLEDVPGAADALKSLATDMDIVVFSNVNPSQALHREQNLKAVGMDYPLISNSGLKGEGVRLLTEKSGRPSFFVDDIPQHHEAVAAAAPHVTRIHLIGDERLRPLLPPSPHADYRADDWASAESFIRETMRADRR